MDSLFIKMSKILVLCTGNSCRSQMAEGWLNYLTSGEFQVFSAGTNPEQVNPYAIKVMLEVGIDISKHSSSHIDEYINIDYDYVFTVCDNAKEICPIFPNAKMLLHQSFADPAAVKGSEDEFIQQYRITVLQSYSSTVNTVISRLL